MLILLSFIRSVSTCAKPLQRVAHPGLDIPAGVGCLFFENMRLPDLLAVFQIAAGVDMDPVPDAM
jgi:hypothetical protein